MTNSIGPIVRHTGRTAFHPIALAVSAVLLQACAAPPQIAKKELAVEPLLRVGHSLGQTARSYYQLGKYHHERGNHSLAIEAYKQSLALDSRQLEARNALAAVYSLQGRLDEAKSLLLDLVAEYPGLAHPYNNLGYVYFIEGNYSAAVQTLKRALVLDFANERARNNLKVAELALAKNAADRLPTLQAAASVAAVAPEHAANAANIVNTVHTGNLPKALNQMTLDLMSRSQQNNAQKAELTLASAAIPADVPHQANKPAPPDQPTNNNPGIFPQTRMELVEITANVLELRLKPGLDHKPVDALFTPEQPIAKQILTEALGKTMESPIARTVIALGPIPPAPRPANGPVAVTSAARIVVANGNGVNGMAKRISQVLGKSGINVSSLANERPYIQQENRIYYRAGYEHTATAVMQALLGRATMVPASKMASNIDVRLVIGKQAVSQLAQLEEKLGESLVTARAGAEKDGGKAPVSSM